LAEAKGHSIIEYKPIVGSNNFIILKKYQKEWIFAAHPHRQRCKALSEPQAELVLEL
jgi:hypothetical protein